MNLEEVWKFNILETIERLERRMFGPNNIFTEEERPMDAPWIVMDSTYQRILNWEPSTSLNEILKEIAMQRKTDCHVS